jgi:hypothetical protein
MTDATAAERELFEGGPPHRLETWAGLFRAGGPQVARRALFAAGVSWVPLAVLSAAHGDFLPTDTSDSFLLDFSAHARFLIAVPLLILAEPICAPRLTAIAREFLHAGLVEDADRERYNRAVNSTRRLMNSRSVEIAAIALAYAVILALSLAVPMSGLLRWHRLGSGTALSISPAGWWVQLVSHPLLLVLLLGWLWRVCLWTRFLWLMNQLDLRLIPTHPDHAAGLKFVGSSLQGFIPLGFVAGIVLAGPAANQVVHHGASPLQFGFLIAGFAVCVVGLLSGPVLVFSLRLLREQNRGIFEYGGLAVRMGEQLERKWLKPNPLLDNSALEVPDFSATTDLYSIVANVYGMLIVPLEVRSVALLAGATLLPFLPLALLAAPLDVILKKLAGLLL